MSCPRQILPAIVLAVLLAACGSATAERSQSSNRAVRPATPTNTATPTPTPTPTATNTPTPDPKPTVESVPRLPPSTCPVTRPGETSFIPPEPYPATPPPLYDAVWYGTAELWTMLSPAGENWSGLPYHDDFSEDPVFVQKTFWWRDGYSWTAEPRPQILVTGKRLDKPGPTFEAGGPGTNGNRSDIGSFMLVGIGVPTPGCWEITASYADAELSYVVWIGTQP